MTIPEEGFVTMKTVVPLSVRLRKRLKGSELFPLLNLFLEIRNTGAVRALIWVTPAGDHLYCITSWS